jgi:hypothetical protein
VLPLLVPGLILGALGFVLSVLMFDWWGAYFLVSLVMTVVALAAGELGWGLASLGLTLFLLLVLVREYRASRPTQE